MTIKSRFRKWRIGRLQDKLAVIDQSLHDEQDKRLVWECLGESALKMRIGWIVEAVTAKVAEQNIRYKRLVAKHTRLANKLIKLTAGG